MVKDQSTEALCYPLMVSFWLQETGDYPVVMIDVRTAAGKRKYLDYQYCGLDQKMLIVLIGCLLDQQYLAEQMKSCTLVALEIVGACKAFLDYFFLQFRQGEYQLLLLLCESNYSENNLKNRVKNRYRVEEENIVVLQKCRQPLDSFQEGKLRRFFSSLQAKTFYYEYFDQVKLVAQKIGYWPWPERKQNERSI